MNKIVFSKVETKNFDYNELPFFTMISYDNDKKLAETTVMGINYSSGILLDYHTKFYCEKLVHNEISKDKYRILQFQFIEKNKELKKEFKELLNSLSL